MREALEERVSARFHRAGVRRLIALHPECRRMQLFDLFGAPELTGLPAGEVATRMAAYALDPGGRPLVGDPAWLERCLVATPLAPGCAEIEDDIAAILAAGALGYDDRLLSRRFAPRADEAIAAATFSLDPDAARRAILALAREPGPDESLLHLALLQAGLAVAWRPDLVEMDGAAEIIDALLGLVDRKSPRPLLDAVTPILGSIAVELPRVGDDVMQKLIAARTRMTERRGGGESFLGEFRALDRERKMPDEDYYMTLPDRQVVEACAKILGRAAEALDREGFVALQREVLDGEVGETLMPHFVGGLINAAAIGPLAQLAAYLMSTRDAESRALALDIAAQLPLDEIAEPLIDALSDDRKELRIKAIRAVGMLEPGISVPALLARLDDPEPAVCAVAAK
ncbi:MAG TPA: HEAT repeat domain-containing protein, partial [Kofleriaceae bacterium]